MRTPEIVEYIKDRSKPALLAAALVVGWTPNTGIDGDGLIKQETLPARTLGILRDNQRCNVLYKKPPEDILEAIPVGNCIKTVKERQRKIQTPETPTPFFVNFKRVG